MACGHPNATGMSGQRRSRNAVCSADRTTSTAELLHSLRLWQVAERTFMTPIHPRSDGHESFPTHVQKEKWR